MEIEDLRILIENDRNSRDRVELAHRKKFEVKARLHQAKDDLSDEYWKQAKSRVEQRRFELDAEIIANEKNNELDFEKAKADLIDKFNDNKEQWINDIILKCWM